MEYNDLEVALKIFSLTDRANLKEIKAKHKELVRKFHPDTGCNDNDKIRQVNEAYQIIIGYCSNYRFAFSRDEFMEQCPEERLRQQFADDPVWGGAKKP